MNDLWLWRLAQDRHQELIEEAKQARLDKESGIRDSVPDGLRSLGLVLLGPPFTFMLVRAWFRL